MEPQPLAMASDFVPFATGAIDFHHALNLPHGPLAAPRGELDTLHAHLIAVHRLLDTHAARTRPIAEREAALLQSAAIRVWQAAVYLHAAFHAAASAPESAGNEDPAGPGEVVETISICRRHRTAAARMRRQHTPADLAVPSVDPVER